ncbi:50S ribosomal protein L25/general stress protein Ctc [Alkalicaulis satelles]|uniref:Large ribosomal subunit protein bL25 n=1 Tax=Alkalicaulis satelles TaxID=2609175 RepID=A0A5M6ZQK5_9PROT|nr:50S ribosomal protein L25/general stress protein Ctc [Alkalicaulis satelles]KAA5804541.1 50S ribosomal protein L25/general stress protein Ctc [Alkalicaulis satelles]
MSDIVLSVEVRERTGKGGSREVRRNGLVPGVLYGGDRDPVAITLKNNELVKAINSGKFLSQMITIDHKGETQTVLTRDVQFDPVRDFPLHVDFQRVNEDSVISVEVPVHFLNDEKAPGIKRGGVLNVVRHAIEVYSPAGSIPEAIEIDISHMNIGDSLHISEVTLPEGVTPTITDRDFTIATMQGSRAVIEDEASDEDETGEEAEVEDENESED